MGRWFTPSKSDGSGQVAPSPAPMPEPPKIEDAAAVAEKKSKLKKQQMATSKSIFTDPLGSAGSADIARKTLLGQ
jgi:hypothetical protein